MMGAAETAACMACACLALAGAWRAARHTTHRIRDHHARQEHPMTIQHDRDYIDLPGASRRDLRVVLIALAFAADAAGHDGPTVPAGLLTDLIRGERVCPTEHYPALGDWAWTEITSQLTRIRQRGTWSPWLGSLLAHARAEAAREACEALHDTWEHPGTGAACCQCTH